MNKEKKKPSRIKQALGVAGLVMVSSVGTGLIGYKIGFDKVYKTFIPGSYRVSGLKRYVGTVKELDISALGVKVVNSPSFH